MPRRPPRILPLVGPAVLAAGLAVAAPAAQATAFPTYTPTGAECRLATSLGLAAEGAALVDPLGYIYDTGNVDTGYATLDDGGTVLATPSVLADDAWDRFGALFVGPRSGAAIYGDAAEDPLGCEAEASGRQVAFKSVAIGGLDVRRRLFVSASQGSGVRILDSVTNPTAAPITTGVYVGDLRDNNFGSLGSDSTTRLTATSSGETTLSTADRWLTTGDGRNIGPDPALAHVWGGPDAEEPANFVRSGAQAGGAAAVDSPGALDSDQLGWGWEGVTLAPGETRSFLSWEAMRSTIDGRAASQAAAAAAAAADLSGAPLSRVYQGLTEQQIGQVRNWAKPPVDGEIGAVTGASTASTVTLTASGVDFGSSALATCTGGTLTWDFGDGTSATGATVAHRFAAGTAEVALTIASTCGESKVLETTFEVTQSAPDPAPEPEPEPESLPASTKHEPAAKAPQALLSTPAASIASTSGPAPAADALGLAVDVAPKLSAAELSKRGVRPTLTATEAGTVRLVLSGGGLKIVKTKEVVAGVETPAAMKLGPKDGKRVRGLKTLQLRAKLTTESGAEVITSHVITVGR